MLKKYQDKARNKISGETHANSSLKTQPVQSQTYKRDTQQKTLAGGLSNEILPSIPEFSRRRSKDERRQHSIDREAGEDEARFQEQLAR